MASEKEKQSHGEHKENEKRGSQKKDETRAEKQGGDKEARKSPSKSSTSSHSEHSQKEKSSAKSNRESKGHESKLAPGKSGRTTDHEIIRHWIEARGGSPAAVKATESGDDPGLLRINFPGYSGEGRLENISWDDFFEKFDEKNLAFLYQDETRDGETSRFWKFVSRGDDKD